MKRVLILVMVLVFSMTLLVACGDKGGDDLSGTKITVILPDNEHGAGDLHRERTEQFTEETGIEVELINKGWEAAADDILGDLASGGGSYDVIEFDNAWIAKFIENGWIIPLDDYMSDEIKDGMVQGLLDKFKVDGNYYGITWNNDTRFFMYNSAMLKKAGIDAPKTWNDVSKAAKVLQDKGISKYAYLDTYKQEQMGTNQLMFVAYSFGGEFVNEAGEPVVNSNEGVREAYEWLAKAYKDKVFGPSSMNITYEEVADSFFSGSFPLFLQAWPGVYADSQDKTKSKIVGDIEVADFSVSKTGKEQAILTLPEAMAITATSKNPEAAWKYIEYMSTKDFDKERALEFGCLPIWQDLYNDEDLLAKYPYWEQFGEQSSAGMKGYPEVIWVDDFADIVAKVSQKILAGNISVKDGLDEMQKLLEDAKAKAEAEE